MLISLLKNRLILAAILLLFLGAGGFAFKNNFFSKNKSEKIGISESTAFKQTKADLDHDGLEDWQETVEGTDPKNPDSDADGYLDGEEIASGHDPLKAAPNDLLANRRPKENFSENIAKKFIEKVTAEKQKLVNAGKEDQAVSLKGFELQKIADEAMANLSRSLGALPRTSLWDLNIGKDKSGAAIKNYALSAIKIISENFSALNNDSPEPTIKAAIENSDFSKLNSWISVYEKTESELKQLSVPSPLLSVHQDALGILAGLSGALKSITRSVNDPINQVNETRKYLALTRKWSDLIEQASQEIQNKYKITFSDEELR